MQNLQITTKILIEPLPLTIYRGYIITQFSLQVARECTDCVILTSQPDVVELLSSNDAGGGNVDALQVVGAGALGGADVVVDGRAVAGERDSGVALRLRAACEADVDQSPAVVGRRSTRRSTCRDQIVRITDEILATVSESNRHRLVHHARPV